jgi:hypothetical protein
MDYTYLDYFNYYLKTFLNELNANFPDFQSAILANYRSFLEGREDKSDLYVKYYYTKINNYLSQIAKRDESLFDMSGLIFIEGVDMHDIWGHSMCNADHKKAIWMYLQILMILGRKIIPNHNEIKDMLEKVSGGVVAVPTKVEKTLTEIDNESKDLDKADSGVFNLGNIAGSLGSLGSLASGLSGLGNITEMLGNVDLQGMLGTFTEAMNTLANETQASGDNFVNNDNNNDNDNNTSESSTDGVSSTESTTETQNQPANNIFADLAKDMANTFNFDDMAKDGEPKDVGDAFKKFMSGDNPAKLMNLVTKFGSKLQSDISSGKLNQKDLLKQTLGMMGGMANPTNQQAETGSNQNQTMPNMAQMQQMAQQMAASNPQLVNSLRNAGKPHAAGMTKDRLRAKLAQKQQAESQSGKQ